MSTCLSWVPELLALLKGNLALNIQLNIWSLPIIDIVVGPLSAAVLRREAHAIRHLLKQVTDHSIALNLQLDVWSFILNYLATRGPRLQPFVIASLIHLLCRVAQFEWFDDDRFRDVVKESANFLLFCLGRDFTSARS